MVISEYIHNRHNVSVLIYHIVCPAKYRRVVFDAQVERVVWDICLEISKRYEIEFLEIGVDQNHVHFLVQSVPGYSPKKSGADYKEHYSPRSFQVGARSQEVALEWRVLGERVLRQYGW